MRFLMPLLALLALAPAAVAQVPSDEPDPSIADGSAQTALDAASERWLQDCSFRVRRRAPAGASTGGVGYTFKRFRAVRGT